MIETTDEFLGKAKSMSLHFGQLLAAEKEVELRSYYGVASRDPLRAQVVAVHVVGMRDFAVPAARQEK
jgi:hypothetical protein